MIKSLKLVIACALGLSLCGCATIQKMINPNIDKEDQYNYMVASLLENSSFRSNAIYYDLTVEVINNGSSYDYTVTLNNPNKAMLNVGIMVMDNLGEQGNQDHIESIGVLDEHYDLIPGQVYNQENLMNQLQVNGTVGTLPDSLKILVTWNDDDFSNYISDFYVVDVQDELITQF